MPGYMQPCRYCNQLVDPDSNTCPACGKINPVGPMRCPKCRNPIQKGWVSCSNCGLSLKTVCTGCGKETFFGDHCDHCGAELKTVCPHCGFKQSPLNPKCEKCGKEIEKQKRKE